MPKSLTRQELGHLLAEMIRNSGLKDAEIARLAGVSVGTVRGYREGAAPQAAKEEQALRTVEVLRKRLTAAAELGTNPGGVHPPGGGTMLFAEESRGKVAEAQDTWPCDKCGRNHHWAEKGCAYTWTLRKDAERRGAQAGTGRPPLPST